jgi:uncharacterized repeat protein (TIGR03803 family)
VEPPVEASDGLLYGMTQGGGTAYLGTVYRIGPDGTHPTVLHDFQGGPADGGIPTSRLVQGADGALYGTTTTGGAGGKGTVFRMALGGTIALLHSFTGPDGDTPQAGLLLASDGNFYGTTNGGGTTGWGTVYRITAQGTFTSLFSFGPFEVSGAQPASPLVEVPDGSLYGSAAGGGSLYGGVAYRITKAGQFNVVHEFSSALPEGQVPGGGFALARDGNLYGVTTTGSDRRGTAFRMTLAGEVTVLHKFASAGGRKGMDGAAALGTLLQATDGALYGVTAQGGEFGARIGDGTVYRLEQPAPQR